MRSAVPKYVWNLNAITNFNIYLIKDIKILQQGVRSDAIIQQAKQFV